MRQLLRELRSWAPEAIEQLRQRLLDDPPDDLQSWLALWDRWAAYGIGRPMSVEDTQRMQAASIDELPTDPHERLVILRQMASALGDEIHRIEAEAAPPPPLPEGKAKDG